MKLATGLVVGLVCGLIGSAAHANRPVQRTLSFEDRVKAQRAIERVYYAHQLGATKPFDEAVPTAVLESKVRKYLDQTAALDAYWKTAVTDSTLQRELERMAHGTKMPERLLELYAALGNDSFLIKECLARPALVDRLTHNFYAFDPTLHGKAKAQADAIRGQLESGALSPSADHLNRTVIELVMGETESSPAPTEPSSQQKLSPDEFKTRRAELPALPGEVSAVRETRDEFVFTVVLSETKKSVRVASYVVTKTAWDTWWETARRAVRGDAVAAVASGIVDLPEPRQGGATKPSATCADDRWESGLFDVVPEPRTLHTAVWTGSVMVVWGGQVQSEALNSGGRYDPATDSWESTATDGAPSARAYHSAVWSGSVMVVWGGARNIGLEGLRTGGRYDPITNSWSPTSITGAPPGRVYHTAVWAGSSMAIWGGQTSSGGGATFGTGALYDPFTDTWRPMSTAGAPEARVGHSAVWTGAQMVVWGGHISRYPNLIRTGGRYDPVTDRWTETNWIDAPSGRSGHSTIWTGSEMIVWGGWECDFDDHYTCHENLVDTGARYDPVADTWRPLSTDGAPPPMGGHFGVWTGSEMLVGVGGSRGRRYDPATDSWAPIAAPGAMLFGGNPSIVWTGSQVVIWGGFASPNIYFDTGARYDPATDSWTPTGANMTSYGGTPVWTGSLMVSWSAYGNGGRYDPATNNWTPISAVGAPAENASYTAVWTGSQVVLWAGGDYPGDPVDGGRYDPVSDLWTPMATTGAPSVRYPYTALWTGSRMVLWSSGLRPDYIAAGSRYDPATDSWASMSTVGAPSARERASVVWAGNKMVVWGGVYRPFSGNATRLNTGGRYDPDSDIWAPTSTIGAPVPRDGHTAIWTGSRMVVWGSDSSRSGGRYDPVADSWTPTSTVNAPAARTDHSAIWTGSRMVIWGGNGVLAFPPSTGGSYDPESDRWTRVSTTGAPPKTIGHTALWLDNQMILWGGNATGERYFPGTAVDDDCDNDGFREDAGDCNDHDATVYPGAPQRCDGVNNNCSDPSWPHVPADEADSDGDGFGTCQGDCNDQLGSVYPGSPQFCDGVNNNCLDPTWPAVPANEADRDGDGYRVCDGDCDDTNSRVFPGAPEYCDGRDNDCDGEVDEGSTVDCFDANICTNDLCVLGTGCVFVPNNDACDDQNVCTTGDTCSAGICHGTALSCDDDNPCTDDFCDPQFGCAPIHSDYGTPCDNHNACDGAEFCDGYGTCVSAYPPQCDDHVACTRDFCDPQLGCVYEAFPVGTACGDGDACNGAELCDGGGLCAPGVALDCDDLSLCSQDYCDSSLGCQHVPYPAGTSCSDGNICNGTEVCTGAIGCPRAVPLTCSDNNPCTTDTCNPATGCVFTNNADACDDGNACTSSDLCSAGACIGGSTVVCGALDQCHDAGDCNPATGACSSPIKADGTLCDDASLCTSGETCRSGTCTPASSGLNHPAPKSAGYYKKLCDKRAHNQLPYQGDQLTESDALCVGQLTSTFAGIATIDDICGVIDSDHRPPHGGRHHGGPGDGPNGKDCDKGEDELIATALNICRARVCEEQGLDSRCHGNAHTTVSQSFTDADAILDDTARDKNTCKDARCELSEINNGHALEMNSLNLARENGKVRLTWSSPVLDDGSGSASSYELWRRPMGLNDAFVKIGTTSGLTFLDATAGSGTWEYDIRAVIPGN